MEYKNVKVAEEEILVLSSPTVDQLIRGFNSGSYDFYKEAMADNNPGNRSTSQAFFNGYILPKDVDHLLHSFDWDEVVFYCGDDLDGDSAALIRDAFLPAFSKYIEAQRARPELAKLQVDEKDDEVEEPPQKPGVTNYFEKIRTMREKGDNVGVPIGINMRQDKHSATLAAMMTTPVVYQSLLRDIKEVGALTADVKHVIDSICLLPAEYRELVVKVTGFYGLANAIGGPATKYIDGTEHQLYVAAPERAAFEQELAGAIDIPAKSFKKFYQQPPGIHDAAKHAATNDRDTDNPIGRTFADPNGMLQPLVAMRSTDFVSASKSNIYYNVKAKQSAFLCCVVDMGSDNYGPSLTDEDKDRVYDKNIYVNLDVEPHPIMTRYTPAPVADDEFTSTASKAFKGFRWHSQRYDNKVSDPKSKTDKSVNSAFNRVPQNALGGDRASTYLAVRATDKGDSFVRAVEKELAGHNYKPAAASAYDNYHDFFVAGVHDEILSPQQIELRTQYSASPAKVTKWWEDIIFPELLKVFASHLGFMSVLGLELSIAGLPQMPGLLTLSELGALTQKTCCIAGHELVDKFGAPIIVTDGYAGQNQIGGEFRPIDPKYFKTDKMDVVTLGNGDEKDVNYNTVIPHKRYVRRVGLVVKPEVMVLIDFTIPGLLYCPQNAEKANDTTKEFKGQKILVDDVHTVGLYEPKELARYNAFMVYFPVSVFTNGKLAIQFKKLEETHSFSISPAPVLCLMGLYVVGWRKDKYKPTTAIRGLNFNQLRHNMLAHIVAKTTMLMEHFNGYPANPKMIYNHITSYTRRYPEAYKTMRLGIGTLKSYKEYAKRTRDPNSKDLKFTPDKKFEEYMKTLDAINDSILDDPALSKWGAKYENDPQPIF